MQLATLVAGRVRSAKGEVDVLDRGAVVGEGRGKDAGEGAGEEGGRHGGECL